MHRFFKLGYLIFQQFFKLCEFIFGRWTHGINAGDIVCGAADTWDQERRKKKKHMREDRKGKQHNKSTSELSLSSDSSDSYPYENPN